MTDHPPTDAERRSKLWSLIKDIRIGLFTTQHGKLGETATVRMDR